MNESFQIEIPPTLRDPRFTEIDGVRGWAALIVVLFHPFHETFGIVQPALREHIPFFFVDGELAVFVFFVLSGDALAVGYIRTSRREIIDRLLAKRYFRLTIPIAMSCMAAYVLMKGGWTYNLPAAKLVEREDWLGVFVRFVPQLQPLIRYSLYEVFANHQPMSSYNPFLWTMSIEMIGSLLVFAFLYLSASLRRPLLAATVIAVFLYLFNSWFALFFVGIAFGYLRRAGVFERVLATPIAQVLSAAAILAIVVAASIVGRTPSLTSTWFWFNELLSIVLVGAIYSNRWALVAFRSRLSIALGAISFPLYLVQFCVLISYTSWMIVISPALTMSRVLFIACTSTVVCLLAATAFYAIEKPLLSLLDWLVKEQLRVPTRPDAH